MTFLGNIKFSTYTMENGRFHSIIFIYICTYTYHICTFISFYFALTVFLCVPLFCPKYLPISPKSRPLMKGMFLITQLFLLCKDNFDLCCKTHYSESYLPLYIFYIFGTFLFTGPFFFQFTLCSTLGGYFKVCSPLIKRF